VPKIKVSTFRAHAGLAVGYKTLELSGRLNVVCGMQVEPAMGARLRSVLSATL